MKEAAEALMWELLIRRRRLHDRIAPEPPKIQDRFAEQHAVQAQSLAEACVSVGAMTPGEADAWIARLTGDGEAPGAVDEAERSARDAERCAHSR